MLNRDLQAIASTGSSYVCKGQNTCKEERKEIAFPKMSIFPNENPVKTFNLDCQNSGRMRVSTV